EGEGYEHVCQVVPYQEPVRVTACAMITRFPHPPDVITSPIADDSAAGGSGALHGEGHRRGRDRMPLVAEFRRSWRSSGPCGRQLVQVVRRGDKAPLARDLRGTAQEELPEAPDVFHDPEHRLHRSLAQSVTAPPPPA